MGIILYILAVKKIQRLRWTPPRPRVGIIIHLNRVHFLLDCNSPQPCDAAFQLPYRLSCLAAIDIGRPTFSAFGRISPGLAREWTGLPAVYILTNSIEYVCQLP